MTAGKNKQGIKSALEIAMERLEKKEGRPRTLSDEQKEALSEVEQKLQARIAEEEILTGQKLAEVRARGDLEEAAQIESWKNEEVARLKREAERRKEQIRGADF